MKAVKKYQQAKEYKVPELQFLKNYSYDLGSEDLVQYGGEEWAYSPCFFADKLNFTDPGSQARSPTINTLHLSMMRTCPSSGRV